MMNTTMIMGGSIGMVAMIWGLTAFGEPAVGAKDGKDQVEATGIPLKERPKVEVVFVLDSTGSMGGLIEGAKDKIWSIANSIIARKPTPNVRIGLVSYRDRGDDYITKRFDLTDDIDMVFKNLQSFQAAGGGDGPESVNQALHEAVSKITWTSDRSVQKVIFLVGDYPPHMDYVNDVKYPKTCETAVKKDLIINTVQCGNFGPTTSIWQDIARRSEGAYIALAQSGGMTAVATPYDKEIANISADLGKTVVTYGTKAEQSLAREKAGYASSSKLSVAADRAVYNMAAGGKAIQGKNDLINDLVDGTVKLKDVKESDLSPEMKKMTADERKAYIAKQTKKRNELNSKLETLVKKRAGHIEQERKRLVESGKGDAFDLKVAEIIEEQSKK